jgi:hypothetical protein
MLDLAIAADLAVRSARHTAQSALPDAPVVVPRQRVRTRTRARLADGLHRVAAALEPRREGPASGRMDATPACR